MESEFEYEKQANQNVEENLEGNHILPEEPVSSLFKLNIINKINYSRTKKMK